MVLLKTEIECEKPIFSGGYAYAYAFTGREKKRGREENERECNKALRPKSFTLFERNCPLLIE